MSSKSKCSDKSKLNHGHTEKIEEDYITLLLSDRGNEPVDVDIESTEMHLPRWYDANRFRRGQQLIRYHIAGIFAGMLAGLMSILAVPTILQVLMCTRKSGTVKDAYRRYLETIYHTLAWSDYDLYPGSKSWKSIEMVRRKHASARNFCEHSRNITICQCDMAVTQFAFFGFAIIKSKMLGIHSISEPEMKDIIHFWRVLGYLMGIKDEFNVCVDDARNTVKRLNGILERVLRPSLEKPDESFVSMAQTMVGGMKYFNSVAEYNVVLYLTKRIAGCEGFQDYQRNASDSLNSNEYNKLSRMQRFIARVYIFLSEYAMAYSLGRQLINLWIRFDEFSHYYFPWTAIIDFGFAKSYVRIFDSKRI